MRIARDLHDSAGHAINVILVQAGAARLLQQRDPEGSRVALETIEDVARETIGEIDRLVRVLRDDRGDDGVEPPGLAALDALVDRHRAAGLGVTVAATGRRRPLVAGVDRAAYRILQEALTNAALHGDGSAHVDLGFGEEGVELTVTNRARAGLAPRPGGGHGLVGMRERALLLGGSLDAGADDGLFRVHARLPVNGDG
jgi:signal transduction histidine kinase